MGLSIEVPNTIGNFMPKHLMAKVYVEVQTRTNMALPASLTLWKERWAAFVARSSRFA